MPYRFRAVLRGASGWRTPGLWAADCGVRSRLLRAGCQDAATPGGARRLRGAAHALPADPCRVSLPRTGDQALASVLSRPDVGAPGVPAETCRWQGSTEAALGTNDCCPEGADEVATRTSACNGAGTAGAGPDKVGTERHRSGETDLKRMGTGGDCEPVASDSGARTTTPRVAPPAKGHAWTSWTGVAKVVGLVGATSCGCSPADVAQNGIAWHCSIAKRDKGAPPQCRCSRESDAEPPSSN